MSNFFEVVLLFFALCGLVIQPAYAGEPMQSGTILTSDSYVFTIEEAKELMLRMEELELKELKLSEYESLTFNLERQIKTLDITIELKDLQIKEYKNMKVLTDERLRRVERREKAAKLERWGFFVLGIGVTAGSIIIADRLDDYVENN